MNLVTTPTSVYAHLLKLCAPLEIDHPLGRHKFAGFAYSLPEDATVLVKSLQHTFSRDTLIEAGAMRPAAEHRGELLLAPALAAPGNLITLHSKQDSSPCAIISSSGSLASNTLAITEAVRDYRNKRLIADELPLLVTFSIADCALLMALGFPATTASGLDTVRGPEMAKICGTFSGAPAINMNGAAASDGPQRAARPKIVLVDWNLTQWDVTGKPHSGHMLEHLRRLRTLLHAKLPQIAVWRPPAQHLNDFVFVANYGDRKNLTDTLLRSVQISSVPAFPDLVQVKPKPPDIVSTSAALFTGGPVTERTKRIDNYRQALHRDVIGPLLEEGLRCPDMMDRNNYALIAAHCSQFYKGAAELISAPPDGESGLLEAGDKIRTLVALSREIRELARNRYR